MRKLIPDFILQQQTANQTFGTMQAAVVFIDIAGFTAMTSSLMQNGKEGAEVVSAVINQIFTPAIKLIHLHGGFIATFAGDAFTAVFPADNTKKTAGSAALAADSIIQLFINHGNQQTRFGNYQLSVKIGLAFNTVNWQLIHTDQQTAYYFDGAAIDQAAYCEHQAAVLELITNKTVQKLLPAEVEYLPKTADYLLVKSLNFSPDDKKIKKKSNQISLPNITTFMPEHICSMHSRGEFREVISCFISFLPCDNLTAKLAEIINLCNLYGGYFNKIDFGDKGGVILVLFGAPVAREKIFFRAADFILQVINMPDFTARAGLSFGTAFTGFVGSLEREEYTALGETVNLAARLMMKADVGTILTDSRIAEECSSCYQTAQAGEYTFKGFSKPIAVFRLISKKQSSDISAESEEKFIGRTTEQTKILSQIETFSTTLKKAALIVEGLPGIGKSRLLQNIRTVSKTTVNWLLLPCDEILRKSFNPLIHFLTAHFNLQDKDSAESFQQSFQKFCTTINSLSLRTELIAQQDIIAALLGKSPQTAVTSKMEAKEINQQTKKALNTFFTALAEKNGLILQIEDAHWLDQESANWLNGFYRETTVPVLLLISSRLNDDGSSLNLFANFSCRSTITLAGFTPDELKQLILFKLNSSGLKLKSVNAELFNYIQEKSEGNPFFCSQILLFLLEKGLISTDGKITTAVSNIPASINAIILARVDRLNSEVRETVKTASILGREFSVEILSAMLKNIAVDLSLKTAEQEVIWNHLSEIKYIFHHALIRESIYEMQLKEQLRKLHNLAAEAIELLYSSEITNHYHELADHYLKAENQPKAHFYLYKAATAAENSYHNSTALDLYGKLIAISKTENSDISDDYLHALIHSGVLCNLTGEVTAARDFFTAAIFTAQKEQNLSRLSEAKRYLGNIHLDRSELQEAFDLYEECVKISKQINDQPGLAFALSNIGAIYWSINDRKALKYYQQRLAIMTELADDKEIARSLYLIGTYYQTFENNEMAVKYYQKALKLAEQNFVISVEMNSLGNLGIIFYHSQQYKEAHSCYRKQLKIAKRTGNRLVEALALGNIGLIYDNLSQYSLALNYYLKKLKIISILENIKEQTITAGNIGDIYFETGKYDKAEQYYLQQLSLSIYSSDKRNEADANGNLGNYCLANNKITKAIKHYKIKLKIGKQVKNIEQIFGAYYALSVVDIRIEKFYQAYELILKVKMNAYKKESRSDLILALLNLGIILMKQNKLSDSLVCFQDSVNLSQEIKDLNSLSLALSGMADAYTALNQFDLALENYTQAAKLAREIGVRYYLTTILNNHAALYLKTGKLSEATQLNQEALAIAQEIKVPDDIFAAEYLQAQIVAATNPDQAIELFNKMAECYPEIKEQSRILFQLTKLTKDAKIKKKATRLIKRQIKQTDNPEYAEMLKEIDNV